MLVFFLSGLAALETPPETSRVADLYSQALVADKFSGSAIDEVLLSDPEILNGEYRYSSEFTVKTNGKKIRCEDWRFTLKNSQQTWYISAITRGRCSG
jgi:hypothetical protein